jgi:uncharacterized membrane protein YfcA
MGMIPAEGLFWGTAVLTILLVGIAKGGFGSGPAAIATPLLSLVMPVADAAALLLPILILADLFVIGQYRRSADKSNLRTLLPGALVGVLLGALFFYQFINNERVLKTGIGLIAVGFVLYQMMGSRLSAALPARKPPGWVGSLVGIIAGFISTLAHVGGPVVVIYLLPQRLSRQLFVGTAAAFFFIVNTVKLLPYGALGLLKVGNLWTTLLLLPVAYIGVRLGVWLNQRFSERWFNITMYTILLLVGTQLILGKSFIEFAAAGFSRERALAAKAAAASSNYKRRGISRRRSPVRA